MFIYSRDISTLSQHVKDIEKYNTENACQFCLAYNEKKHEGNLTIGFNTNIKTKDNIKFFDYRIQKEDLV